MEVLLRFQCSERLLLYTTQWYSQAVGRADDIVWFEFVESKVFSKQVRELGEVLTRIQSD